MNPCALPQQGQQPRGGLVAVEVRAAEQLMSVVTDRSTHAQRRMRALEELALLNVPLELEPLLEIRRQVRSAWLGDYARCLGNTHEGALSTLHQIFEKADAYGKAESVFSIVRLDQAKGERFASKILRSLDVPEEARVAALRGLRLRKSPFARVEALRRITTARDALLLEALITLKSMPDSGDIPYLIDLVSEGEGRAANEAVRLLQELTGYRIGRDAKAWKFWMLKHKAQGTPFRREPTASEKEPETLSYLGIPILGEKIVFVLDSSGSMNSPMPENYSHTRGSKAVEELVRLMPRLPKKGAFDVVFFDSSVSSFSGHLASPDEENLKRITNWLRKNNFEGGTDIHGGLEAAFEREGVEEIILLSDGEPTSGDIIEPRQIEKRVQRWNRWRNVRINTISLGAPAEARNFLYRLAKSHDGICRVMD